MKKCYVFGDGPSFFSGDVGGGGLGNSEKNSCTAKTTEKEHHAVKPNGKKTSKCLPLSKFHF